MTTINRMMPTRIQIHCGTAMVGLLPGRLESKTYEAGLTLSGPLRVECPTLLPRKGHQLCSFIPQGCPLRLATR